MKISINRSKLSSNLSRVVGAAGGKVSLPILVCVRLEVFADGLMEMAATDLDVTVKSVARVDVVERPGAVIVHAKRLSEIVKSLVGDMVNLEFVEAGRLEVRSGKSLFVLNVEDAGDYPALPVSDSVSMTSIDGAALRLNIERTSFCVSSDDSRPNLNGVYFCALGGGAVRMASTDGHRLAQAERSLAFEDGAQLPAGDPLIIPRKGIGEIKRVLDAVGRRVRLGFMENNLVLASGVDEGEVTEVFVRLIDLKFPDFKAVIPKSVEHEVTVDRLAMMSALKRLALLASDLTKSFRAEFEPGTMTLRSENSDMGSAKESISIAGFEGQPATMNLNIRYVVDVLSHTEAERMTIGFGRVLSPALLREEGRGADLFVIMPIRNG